MTNKTCGECRYYIAKAKRCNMRRIICNIQPTDTGCSCFERKPIPKPTIGDRIDRYCKSCGNVTVVDAGYYAGSSFYQCETCGRRGMQDIFPKATVFHKITTTPEVLAPEFVEMMYDRVAGDYRYYSMLTGEFYNSEEEAIAATVAKLKEV